MKKKAGLSQIKPIKGKVKSGWHVNDSQQGMGDYYGTGLTAKIGKMREGTGFQELSKKKMKTPPKSLS